MDFWNEIVYDFEFYWCYYIYLLIFCFGGKDVCDSCVIFKFGIEYFVIILKSCEVFIL